MAVNWSLLTSKLVLLVCGCCCVLLYTLHLVGFHSTDSGAGGLPPSVPCTPVQPLPPSLPHSERVILVTGAAGFIGFHTSRSLVNTWRATVIGLDLMTDYYDPQLKRDRAKNLLEMGVTVYQGDVCDPELLSHLFNKYHFTDVVHLAAQAGVRYSLEVPTTYIHNNVGCFQTLLDTLRHFNYTPLVYASSSTAHGRSPHLPLSPSQPPYPPANIYAASKQINEKFSHSYCSQYGVRSIGLRFFTVYGPWGRPDMAVYKFTENLLQGNPIPVYTSVGAIKRDFTFVSDVVDVILAALDHTPKCCGEVYNVGLGEPVSLGSLVSMLEEELNTTAIVSPSPLMSCDFHVTWADMEETKRVLGRVPRVRLREGLKEFVTWYKDYLQQRELGGASDDSTQLQGLMGEEEVSDMKERLLEHRNKEYSDRISGLRERYEQYAIEQGIPLPDLTKKGFIFYPGKESPGHTVIKAPSYNGNQKLLEKCCLATEQCIGFTSYGEFKNQLAPMKKWVPSPPGHGMYVADMDLCASDLHHCGRHSDCVYTGPANYTCVCHHSYVQLGKYCVERYVEGKVGNAEGAWHLSDQFDGLDWEGMVQGREFVFFQGLDSPGGDYLVVEGGGVGRTREACLSTCHCLAFNTNGILKDSLRPPSGWIQWAGPEYPEHGLYVLDIDYCSLDIEQCPPHSVCRRHAPGNYSCTCLSPWTPTKDHTCTLTSIHIILSTDSEQLPGLVGVINSTLSHTPYPERIVFHIVFSGDQAIVNSYLGCYGYKDHPQIDIVILNASMIREPIKVYTEVSSNGNLASLGNFARFYFHLLFPRLSHALYLDVDVIVLGDVGEVWDQVVAMDTLILAAPRNSPTYGQFLSPTVNKLFRERYGKAFDSSHVTFNAGVYGVNLDLWRETQVLSEVSYWMNKQAKTRLWELGTQPIMLLVAYGRWSHLDAHWNVNGLGWKHMSRDELKNAKLLHWNGKGKPWLENGLYKDLWNSHIPPSCSGCGKCIAMETGFHACQCDSGYTGEQCNQLQRN